MREFMVVDFRNRDISILTFEEFIALFDWMEEWANEAQTGEFNVSETRDAVFIRTH